MKLTKIATVFALAATLSACGYEARDSEMVGQVKKVMNNTPLICPEYADADISLGVMRNGVGSMSSQDAWVVVTKEQAELLKKASVSGEIVKITYDTKRVVFCTSDRIARNVEVLK